MNSGRKKGVKKRQTYFVSYSTGEPHLRFFFECLELVFKEHFELKCTPTELEPGKSQHEAILKLIEECAFGVVCLDGMRPNVLYEYGALQGAGKSVLLFAEIGAVVDVKHFFGDPVSIAVASPKIEIDKQFSDVKDLYRVTWNRLEITKTVEIIWNAYNRTKSKIDGNLDIPKPKLCT